MARRVFPSRLELNRRDGSFRAAPLAKVILTTFVYVSPVQMIPSCDHTGTPLHFHSSTTSGSACLIRVRIRLSTLPRQSPSSLILTSINSDGDLLVCDSLFFIAVSRRATLRQSQDEQQHQDRKEQALPGMSRDAKPRTAKVPRWPGK